MCYLPSESERLALLNEAQPGLLWKSYAEKRLCLACERTFRGRAATARTSPNGLTRLVCPGCGSAPDAWVRLGNPLIDNEVWADWERAIDYSSSGIPDDELVVAL